MQTIIKNLTPAYLDNLSIKDEINSIQADYMNSNIQILKATVSQPLLTEDIILYELLIWDTSEEPIKGTPEEYLNEISDFQDYAADCDCRKLEAKIEIISKKEKLSRIKLIFTI
jgi:hypothetical protein